MENKNSKRIVTYPGTFDPITYGHIDIIVRARELFDGVVVTVARNPAKDPLFSVEERLELIKESVKGFDNVTVDSFDGLVVDHARSIGAISIIRGLRAVSDFEFEFQMALMNRKLADEITTVFVMPNEKYTYLNSTIIRNLAVFGVDLSDFVPQAVADALMKKFSASRRLK